MEHINRPPNAIQRSAIQRNVIAQAIPPNAIQRSANIEQDIISPEIDEQRNTIQQRKNTNTTTRARTESHTRGAHNTKAPDEDNEFRDETGEIKILDPQDVASLDIKQHSTIVVTSKRATGKSVIVQNLCHKLLEQYVYYEVVMFSSTAHLEEEWQFMQNIFDDAELDTKLQVIFEQQEKNIKKQRPILIVLDDVNMMENNRSKLLSKVFSLGRHLFLTMIVSVQYPKYILNGLIRNNIDYLFFSELNPIALKGVYEMVYTDSPFRDFKQFVNSNNKDYQYIFYNNRERERRNRFSVVKGEMMKLVNVKSSKKHREKDSRSDNSRSAQQYQTIASLCDRKAIGMK